MPIAKKTLYVGRKRHTTLVCLYVFCQRFEATEVFLLAPGRVTKEFVGFVCGGFGTWPLHGRVVLFKNGLANLQLKRKGAFTELDRRARDLACCSQSPLVPLVRQLEVLHELLVVLQVILN